jgi:hypothetical protein
MHLPGVSRQAAPFRVLLPAVLLLGLLLPAGAAAADIRSSVDERGTIRIGNLPAVEKGKEGPGKESEGKPAGGKAGEGKAADLTAPPGVARPGPAPGVAPVAPSRRAYGRAAAARRRALDAGEPLPPPMLPSELPAPAPPGPPPGAVAAPPEAAPPSPPAALPAAPPAPAQGD